MSSNRISNQQLVNTSLANLQATFAKFAALQEQASSMKRLNKPSDAPSDVVSAMQLHSGLDRNDQISRNISDASAWLGSADSALTSVVTNVQQVNSLVVQAVNASNDPTSREAIASQIDAIRQSLIGIANTQYAGRPIFGGTASGNAAYQADGTYVGISAPVERTVAPGQRVQVNINGDAVFGAAGTDLFTTLAQLSDAIRNNPSQLSALQANLDTQTQTVQTALADVGARFQRVDALRSQNSGDALTMKKNLSNIEDADLAQVTMEVQLQQVTYQAALAATARAITPSLAQFLQ